MSALHLVSSQANVALPPRVVVASFRFRPSSQDIHGGQDAFVHSSIRALVERGVQVDVITYRGRDDERQVDIEGARVHLLDTPFSRELSAHEAHRSGTWRLLEVMAAYSDAVERFLPSLRAKNVGRPLTILSHDVAEARWVKRARLAGDRIITFAHVLFSEFAVEDLNLSEFERMHETARFPLIVRAIGRLVLSTSGAKQHLERAARLIQRAELYALLPAPARAALEGERAAFVDAQRVLFPAQAMRDKAAAKYPRPDARAAMSVAPWGVDLSPATELDVERLRRKLELGAGDRVLVTMSRISPDKRIDAVVRALARLEERDPALAKRVVTVICGRPTFLDDESFAREVRAEASRLKHARVIFAGYHRGVARTAHLLLASRGRGRFVQVGRYEAFGLGIAEALSLGIPAITSDTDGARAILNAGFDVDRAASVVRGAGEDGFVAALAETFARDLSAPADAGSADVARRIARRFTWDATLESIARAAAEITPRERAQVAAPRAVPQRLPRAPSRASSSVARPASVLTR